MPRNENLQKIQEFLDETALDPTVPVAVRLNAAKQATALTLDAKNEPEAQQDAREAKHQRKWQAVQDDLVGPRRESVLKIIRASEDLTGALAHWGCERRAQGLEHFLDV